MFIASAQDQYSQNFLRRLCENVVVFGSFYKSIIHKK